MYGKLVTALSEDEIKIRVLDSADGISIVAEKGDECKTLAIVRSSYGTFTLTAMPEIKVKRYVEQTVETTE